MNDIDLRRFDLNLLVVFDVLMAERSVTRAAERLGRTQSAVSHSLARLRVQLGDPLLIKGARRMEPTLFATAFIEQAQPILRDIQRVLAPRRRFEPQGSQRIFRIAAPDFASGIFTELLGRLHSEAPGMSIEWTAPRESMLLEVAEGRLDAAMAPAGLRLPTGIAAEPIGALRWRCFARKGHPAFARWGARNWTRWPHLVVRVGDRLESPVNAAAAQAKLTRTIAGWVPNFSVVAPVLAATDLLATLPAPAMAGTLQRFGLDWRRVPFALEPIPHALLWSAARAGDPEVAWLRQRLQPLVKSRFSSAAD